MLASAGAVTALVARRRRERLTGGGLWVAGGLWSLARVALLGLPDGVWAAVFVVRLLCVWLRSTPSRSGSPGHG